MILPAAEHGLVAGEIAVCRPRFGMKAASRKVGAGARYDGHTRKSGSKVHTAVDNRGHLLALHMTPANEQDRTQVEQLAAAVQVATGESVELVYVDQGYVGEAAEAAAAEHDIQLHVVKHTEPKRGFVLLPQR